MLLTEIHEKWGRFLIPVYHNDIPAILYSQNRGIIVKRNDEIQDSSYKQDDETSRLEESGKLYFFKSPTKTKLYKALYDR